MRRQAILAGSVIVVLAAALAWRSASQIGHRPAATNENLSATPPPAASARPAPEAGHQATASTTRPASESLDERPFAEVRAELERLADAGDAHAALRLGRTLSQCNGHVPTTDAQLEELVVNFSASGASISLGGREQAPEALLEMIKLSAAQKKLDCKNFVGLDEKNANVQALRWIERSAALGNADAQALYGSLAFSSYTARSALADAEGVRERKQRAADYVQKSLAQGDALALLEIYKSYSAGTLYPANAEAAYAHLYAYSLTPRASEIAPQLLERTLASGAEKLDPQSLQRARDEGARLATCCGGNPAEAP